MHAEVDQRAAARLALVEKPASGAAALGVETGAEARHAATAQPDAASIVDLAETARIDQILHGAGLRVEAVTEVDAELQAEPCGRVEHLLRLGGIHRHRLFAEDVRPGFEPGDGQFPVLVVRYGDRQDVELFVPDHVDALGIDFREIELLLRVFPLRLDAVGDGDDLDIGVFHVAGEMPPPHAETDNACFQLCHTIVFPDYLLVPSAFCRTAAFGAVSTERISSRAG